MVIALISVVGALASLGGVYAIFDNRRNRRIKALGYEDTGPFPLATASRHEQDYQLTIHYRAGPTSKDEVIEAAYVTYLRFANFGREPIRREDIAPSNPLLVKVSGVRVLDITLAGVNREVAQVGLGDLVLQEEGAFATISFDFLDYEDGGLIRILTTDRKDAEIDLMGDVIGMPSGVFRTDGSVNSKNHWSKIGVGLYAAMQLLAIVGAAYVVKLVTGDLFDAWLMVLPVAALLVPAILAFVVSQTIWPNRAKVMQYPQRLAPPGWLARAAMFRERPMPYPDYLDERVPALEEQSEKDSR